MNKKYLKIIFFNLIIFIILFSGIALADDENEEETDSGSTKTIELYTLPSVSKIEISGTYRGDGHDRQNLGIYMNAGASFEIRQTNTDLGKSLTLNCFNSDSSTETSYTIPSDGSWVTVSVDYASVPFIKTIYDTDEIPTVEIRNMVDTEELNYYYYGDDEDDFFDSWAESENEFAVIEGNRVTFLVPICDIDLIVTEDTTDSYKFSSIDEMLEYYDDFVEAFDRYIGLSYDTDNELNYNVASKFFVKADASGAGSAYYGYNYTAQNGSSISYYLTRGWLSLHEFAHGYEGTLANKDIYLIDTMNNILAYYYQQTFLNDDDGGWLGKILDIENSMATTRESIEEFGDYSYQGRLYFFVNLLNKIGSEEAMAYLHSEYREYVNEGIDYTASDMFAEAFSEFSGYNVIPYLDANKITPSEEVITEVYEEDLPMLYYLRNFVETDEMAEQIREDLELEGIYSLVSYDEIKDYEMSGTLNLEISIDDLDEIYGKTIYLKNGTEVVKEIKIDASTLIITDVPVGIYTLQMPNTKTEAYDYSYDYVVISENSTTEKTFTYTKIETNKFVSDTEIIFKGLGNVEFASIELDIENGELEVISESVKPHVYFSSSDGNYASIQILDLDGNVVYEKNYIGDEINAGDDTIEVTYGYTLVISHLEPYTRLLFYSNLLDEIEYRNDTKDAVSYVITEYGLQKEGTSDEEQYELYKEKVDSYIEKMENSIDEEKLNNKYYYFKQRNALLSMISVLDDTDKEEYLENNKVLINGSAPEIGTIDDFEVVIGEEINFDLSNIEVIDLEDGIIDLDDTNAEISFDFEVDENNKVDESLEEGTYVGILVVYDLDGNLSSKEFNVIVKSSQNTEEDSSNDEENSDDNNTEDNNDDSESIDTYEVEEDIIYGVLAKTPISNFEKIIIDDVIYNVEIKNEDEEVTEGYVQTGMTAIITDENGVSYTYKISVKGDLNGDGIANGVDALHLKAHRNDVELLEGEYLKSADINNDGYINIVDSKLLTLHRAEVEGYSLNYSQN